jgi:hypothetical protein
MATPRRPRRDRAGTYTDEHIDALLTGFDFFHVFKDLARVDSRNRDSAAWSISEASTRAHERKRLAWEELRDDLLPAFIEQHPFERPWAWWVWEAPERKRCLNATHPHDDSRWPAHLDKHLFYGTPRYICFMPESGDLSFQYEDERDYLIRLDLLTAGERELLAAEAAAT